jgi:16S rRNA (guanine527-N7)-methyltransferase
MLAIKGDRATEELSAGRRSMAVLGAIDARVVRCGESLVSPPTTVVVAIRGERSTRPGRAPERRTP